MGTMLIRSTPQPATFIQKKRPVRRITNPEPSDAATPNMEPGISRSPACTAETPSTAW